MSAVAELERSVLQGDELVAQARHWIRRGYRTRQQVEDLHGAVCLSRNQATADDLVAEMRRQWRIRDQWLDPPGPAAG